ncbi:acyl-CoA--sterol O-acyltransferase 1-like [Impatiens glandulifera]|uniref:acyl-CoA--sterol O-acyltransferase 1-like n=1 Tax=Impatiens glandulifera TaxID=253017 RepID=UPI001FB06E40|nr:acyl-CoA--sterol O-acyltransferase 1-like [Impatiens glandulifera]
MRHLKSLPEFILLYIKCHPQLWHHVLLIHQEREMEMEEGMMNYAGAGSGQKLEGELGRFIKVSTSVVISLSYCFIAGKLIRKGKPRLFSFIPIVIFFLTLPLSLQSVHLCGSVAFFVTWLANFKILLLAFDKGPLSDPSLSLSRFIALACFPIKIDRKSSNNQSSTSSKKVNSSVWIYLIKCLLVSLFIKSKYNSRNLNPTLVLAILCLHTYLVLELTMALVAAISRFSLGLDLEAQFNEPYLSSSLQDFWGRRWNVMVSRILRPTVYDPTMWVASRFVGRKWAPLVAVFNTFIVSAIMHEIIFLYLGRRRPTFMISWFFVFHGFCLVVEITLKKLNEGCGGFGLPRMVATILTMGFVLVTASWWFFPEIIRCKAESRAFDEYAIVGAFFRRRIIGDFKFM